MPFHCKRISRICAIGFCNTVIAFLSNVHLVNKTRILHSISLIFQASNINTDCWNIKHGVFTVVFKYSGSHLVTGSILCWHTTIHWISAVIVAEFNFKVAKHTNNLRNVSSYLSIIEKICHQLSALGLIALLNACFVVNV